MSNPLPGILIPLEDRTLLRMCQPVPPPSKGQALVEWPFSEPVELKAGQEFLVVMHWDNPEGYRGFSPRWFDRWHGGRAEQDLLVTKCIAGVDMGRGQS